MILPRGKRSLLTRKSIASQSAYVSPCQKEDRAYNTSAHSAGILFFAGHCAPKLEIWTVNHSIFISLCNLSSAFLCAVQFCTGAVKEVNITVYRNWTWCITILICMVDTANCLPWVTGPTLTFPSCQCVFTKNRIELANWNSDELIWLIAIMINFLAFKFIIVAVTSEAWLTIHTKLSVFMGLLSWYAATFIFLHFLVSLFMWKWPCYVILFYFFSQNEFVSRLRACFSDVQCIKQRQSIINDNFVGLQFW